MRRICAKDYVVLIQKNVSEHILLLLDRNDLRHVQKLKHGEAEDHDEEDQHEGSEVPDHVDEVLAHCPRGLKHSQHLK